MMVGLKYASKTWGLYAVLVLLSLLFLSGLGGSTLAIILNVALLVIFLLLMFNEAAYNGEKACTLAATLDKQVKEGRPIDERLKKQVFSRKTGAIMLAICLAPFLIVSTVNLIAAPRVMDMNAPAVPEEEEQEAFSYDPDAVQEAAPVCRPNIVARLVYMPFVTTYSYVNNGTLNGLFMLYAFIAPLTAFCGYMLGPKLRQKKLHDIALGKKRKARNLKVNKQRTPRGPKAEV